MAAAEIAGSSDRTMRRIKDRYQEFGYDGLFDRRRGKPSILRIPMETAEQVLALYQERYFDFSVLHFHEKLQKEHGIKVSYRWVKQALQGAGLVPRRGKRGPHRRRRPRRPLPGMLLHIDGSKHRWFQDDRYYDLIVILDDATSEIYYAQLVEEESTLTVMAGLREVVEEKGLFARCIATGGATFFIRRRRAGRWTRAGRRKWGGRCRSWGFKPSRRTRRKREGGRSGTSGRGRTACRKSCGWRALRVWKRRMSSCGNNILPSSTTVFGGGTGKGHSLSALQPARLEWCFPCKPNGLWTRTTPSVSGTAGGRSRNADGGIAWRNRR